MVSGAGLKVVSKDRQEYRVAEWEGCLGRGGSMAGTQRRKGKKCMQGSTWLNLREVSVCMSRGPQDNWSSE